MADLSPMIENGFTVLDDEPKTKVLQIIFRNLCVKKGDKQVLRDVSGVAQAGKLLAVMGPSGSGKTTLLNALAGRTVLQSGEITLNRYKLDKQLRRKVCYVLQDDIFFTGLTLRETLTFATMMRLPDYMPQEDKMARMEEIIDTLGLRGCLDTVIGDPLHHGLSGGEKKRVSIACELITDPAIILLDEPTSGLDYGTAYSLIKTLKSYTEQNRKMVIMSIHQPSSRIFHQFDRLILLSEGEMAYFGDTEKVIPFFKELGLEMTEHYNPADFIVELLKDDLRTRRKIVDAAFAKRHTSEWPDVLKENEDVGVIELDNSDLPPSSTLDRSKRASLKFITRSPIYKKVSKRLKKGEPNNFDPEFNDTGSTDMLNLTEDKDKWPTGFFTQFKQLAIRTFKNSKSRILSKLRLLEAAILCILVSLVWFQLPLKEETLYDRFGVIFFIAIHWSFSPLFDAVSSFPSERVVIQKERTGGWYRLSAYYCAKMVSELPLIILCPTLFIAVAYWCVGLNGAGGFFGTIVTVILGAVCGQSIGLFLGILFMDMHKATSLATLVMMAIMLLGGFYTRHLPFWMDWLKWFSFLHYTFHCLLVLEFSGDRVIECASGNVSQFDSCHQSNCQNVSQFESCQPTVRYISSQEIFTHYDFDPSYATYLFPLIFFLFLFRILGYIVLRFVHKPKPI